MNRSQFLKLHWEVLAATDFFMVEIATWHGLVSYSVLVVLELATGEDADCPGAISVPTRTAAVPDSSMRHG